MRSIIQSPKTREEKKAELLGYLPQLPETEIINVLNILLKDDNTQLLNNTPSTIQLSEILSIIKEVEIKESKIKSIDLTIKEIFGIIDEMAVGSSMAAGAVEMGAAPSFKNKKKKKGIIKR
jgi:hypothetical protein